MKKKLLVLAIGLLSFSAYAAEWDVCGHKFYAPDYDDYLNSGCSHEQAWGYHMEDLRFYTAMYCVTQPIPDLD